MTTFKDVFVKIGKAALWIVGGCVFFIICSELTDLFADIRANNREVVVTGHTYHSYEMGCGNWRDSDDYVITKYKYIKDKNYEPCEECVKIFELKSRVESNEYDEYNGYGYHYLD